jgi:hypothetical protein
LQRGVRAILKPVTFLPYLSTIEFGIKWLLVLLLVLELCRCSANGIC